MLTFPRDTRVERPCQECKLNDALMPLFQIIGYYHAFYANEPETERRSRECLLIDALPAIGIESVCDPRGGITKGRDYTFVMTSFALK